MIKHVHIDHFGKFRGFDLALDDAFTVLYGSNEDGKSTLMAFIQMMFYGYNGRIQDVQKNPRKRYKPWDGQDMQGTIEFVADKTLYRLERSFRASNTTDEIKLWNLDKSEAVALPRDQDPGRLFFGLGAEAFEKSVFIGQSGSIIEDGGKCGEITQRLLNLVTTGNENVSYKQVASRLKTAEEVLVSKSERKGLLVENRQVLEQLRRQKIEATDDEMAKASIHNAIRDWTQEKVRREQEKRQLTEQIQVAEAIEKIKTLEETRRHKEEFERLLQQQEQRTALLLRDGSLLSKEDLIEADRLAGELLQIERQQAETRQELEQEEQQKQAIMSAAPREIAADAVTSVRAHLRELDIIRDESSKHQETIRLLEALLRSENALHENKQELEQINESGRSEQAVLEQLETDRDKHQQALRQIQAQLDDSRRKQESLLRDSIRGEAELASAKNALVSVHDRYEERIRYAQQQLDEQKQQQGSQPIPSSAGRSVRMPLLLTGLLLMVAAIVSAILLDPLGLLLLLPAIAIPALSLRRKPTHPVRSANSSTQRIRQTEEAIRQLETEFAQQLQQAQQTEQEAQKSVALIHDQIKEQSTQESKWQDQLHPLRDAFEQAQLHVDEQRRKLERRMARRDVLDEQVKQKQDECNKLANNAASYGLTFTLSGHVTELSDPSADPSAEDAIDSGLLISKALEHVRQTLQELEQKRQHHQHDIQIILAGHRAEDFDQLIALDLAWRNYQEKLAAQSDAASKAKARLEQLGQRLKQAEQAFLDQVSRYQPVTTRADAQVALEEFRRVRVALERAEIELEAHRGKQTERERSRTVSELAAERDQLQQMIDRLAPNGISIQTEDAAWQRTNEQIALLDKQIAELGEQIASEEAAVREKYRHKKNVSQIDEEMDLLFATIDQQEKDYDALRTAHAVLEESFDEIQRNFGPLVNDRTADMFSRLTNGKYSKVRVSRSLEIMVEDSRDNRLHEWGFLSSGTVDQAYLSLRLAIADLVTQDQEVLPLLLDDVFSQYDDERALQGLRFLDDYRRNRPVPTQVLLFTCHRRIADWAQNELQEVRVQTLLQ